MNYQPSFSRGPTCAPVDPALADFDWLAFEQSPGAGPHRDAPAADSTRPHSWPRALAGDPARDGASEEGASRDEASTRAPRFRDGEPAKGNKGEPKPEPPRRRVPDSDIIDVGPRPTRTASSEPVDVRDLFPVQAKGPIPPAAMPDAFGRHKFMKPLLAFLVLEIVVSAGIYFGKRYAESQVIVVPATSSGRSVIT